MDVYQILVYTSLQERATQVSHRNTGKVVSEPLLKGILQNIAADEAKHFNFYRYAFKAIIEVDPNEALKSALKLLPSIDMPGISMPNFREMADVVRRVGIYGPWEYKAIVDEIIKFWNIGSLMHLNKIGSQAQEKIMGLSSRLEKVAKYIERKAQKKSFSFDFLYNQTWAMD
ncbi:TPA: acyl-ACP desaturase, partial [Candidatus Poribacteria bacterium]|nr:acyl-ACP desaturase [Candidatus Poribacteria bacterium]